MNLPEFYTDELFNKTQNKLLDAGSGLLEGDLPDYYKVLGQSNSLEFQNVLNMTNRNIEKSVLENAAKRGSRGGRSLIARAVADNTSKMRYQDLLDSISRKAGLLTTGINTVSGVGDKALNYGGQKNQFNISKAQLELQKEKMEAAKKAQKSKMWGQLLSSGIGAVANIYGVGQLSSLMSAGGGAAGAGGGAGSFMGMGV